MLGRVAFLNPATRTGLIFGADRTRYVFALDDWHDSGLPARNQDVSFLVQDGHVTIVRPFGEDMVLSHEPVLEPEQPRARGPRAGSPTVGTQAIEAFRSQMDYGAPDATAGVDDEGYAEPELDHGEAFPDMLDADPTGVRPSIGKLPFTQPGARSARARWKPYALGGGAAALIVAIAAVATHL